MKPAIRITDLGKRYRVSRGGAKAEYRTLRESLADLARAPLRALGGAPRAEEFWALRGVGLDVEPGEAVGIIGRNGAGKSTLLKILARITRPTTGCVRVRGRVASLLEVGTGFHPELSGRENIYLNGGVLGMGRAEIARKFDAIVDFSGVEAFLDLPVKRYSSGMQMRLAFAVAAHLEPDIVVIDEVLAVGDAEFRRKCLGRMGQVARSGRTVLFVSHNMAAVQHLCTRAVVLAGGTVRFAGDCREAVAEYLRTTDEAGEPVALETFRAPGSQPVIRAAELLDGEGRPSGVFAAGGALTVRLHYDSPVPLRQPRFGVFVDTEAGERLFFLQTRIQHGEIDRLPTRGVAECSVPTLPLAPGRYALTFVCSLHRHPLDHLDRAATIDVEAADYFGTGHLPFPDHGPILVDARWSFA